MKIFKQTYFLLDWLDALSWFTPNSSRVAITVDSPAQQVAPTMQNNPGTPHRIGSPMVRSPASTPTPSTGHSTSPLRGLDGLPLHFIASISLVSFNSTKVASQFVPNEGPSNITTSSTSSGVVGRMGFDVADDVVGAFNGRNLPFPLPGSSEDNTCEFLKEGLQNTSAVVISNQRIPLWIREGTLPLATGWLVHIKVVDNWTGVQGSSSTDMSIAAPQHRAYTQSVTKEVSLLWHHHNPQAELLNSNFASWNPPISSERPSSASTSNSSTSPHQTAIVRDVLKQYHSLKYLRQASLYWTQDEAAVSNNQPWMYESCERMISLLCNI